MPDHGANEPAPDGLRGISLAHHQALAEQDAARLADVAQLGGERESSVKLEVAEGSLASRLWQAHEGVIDVDGLAAAAGLTRDETFAVIDRYRRELR